MYRKTDLRSKRAGWPYNVMIAGTALAGIAINAQDVLAQQAPVAESRTQQFSIVAQPLTGALIRFSRVSGINIVSGASIPGNVKSTGVSGQMSAEQALEALLAGTGYRFRKTGEASVTVESLNASGPQGRGEAVLDTISVRGGAVGRTGRFASGEAMTADTPYQTTAPVSTRSGSDIKLRNNGSVVNTLRTTPGVFTREVQGAGGVGVNIRGHEGRGRVNMMIDGVRQQNSFLGHYGNGGNLYIMQELLAGVDVSRGATSGVQGFGALAGAANFRTIDVDDILLPGKQYGAIASATRGNNGYKWSRMTGGAARFDNGLEFLAAVSGRDSSSYRTGANNRNRRILRSDTREDIKSGLFKVNYIPNDEHALRLSAMLYDNQSIQRVSNDTYSLKYNYTPDGNDFINLRAQSYYNRYKMTLLSGLAVQNDASGFDIANTSRVDHDSVKLSFDYGAALYQDDISRYAGSGNFVAADEVRYGSGKRLTGGVFVDGKLNYGIFDVDAGLRYDYYGIDGYGGPTVSGDPSSALKVDRSTGKLNPRIGVSAQVLPWLQPYVTYAHTYRAPQLNEALFPGAHGSYTSTLANPLLMGEEAKGWEFGANLRHDDLFIAGDEVRFKVNYFTNRVENYIVSNFLMYVNAPNSTRQNGFEIEASYDAGFAFANAAYTRATTDVPFGNMLGLTDENYSVLPKEYATVDLGLRLLDERLVLGGRWRYVSESFKMSFPSTTPSRISPYTLIDLYSTFRISENASLNFGVENLRNEYYATALDVSYASPSYPADQSYQGGRGRTYRFGMTVRF